jgi:hypothetical protein
MAGINNAINMPIMAITTNNSTSVNADLRAGSLFILMFQRDITAPPNEKG